MKYRHLILLSALLPGPQISATIIPMPEMARAVVVSVTVSSNDKADFWLISGVVDAIDFIVAGKKYHLPLAGCEPIREVRFDTVTLVGGSKVDSGPQGFFTWTFSFGPDGSRSYGELPRAQITFSSGRPTMVISGKETGPPHISAWGPLCPGRYGA